MITALLYVQHLLGIGHLVRACALAQGLEAAGIRVVVVSGGMPVPVLDLGASRFEQLPPVRAADESFKVLLDENGTAVSDAWKAQRRERLLAIFDRELPDIVITELYPFGRRQMRFEIRFIGARYSRPAGESGAYRGDYCVHSQILRSRINPRRSERDPVRTKLCAGGRDCRHKPKYRLRGSPGARQAGPGITGLR
jgi:hypothetical protein